MAFWNNFKRKEKFKSDASIAPSGASDKVKISDDVYEQYRDYIGKINTARQVVKNPVMKSYLHTFQDTLSGILEQAQDHPETARKLWKSAEIYLPEVIQIVNTYIHLDDLRDPPENAKKSMTEIEDAMWLVNRFFQQVYNDMFEDIRSDVDVNINVLKMLFKQDGVSGSDFQQADNEIAGQTIENEPAADLDSVSPSATRLSDKTMEKVLSEIGKIEDYGIADKEDEKDGSAASNISLASTCRGQLVRHTGSAIRADVKYASCAKLAFALYGIDTDGDDIASFAPATGGNYVEEEKLPHIKRKMETAHNCCIHNHSWNEIIEMLYKDPHVFDECIRRGCTKSVVLDINDTLRNPEWTEDMYRLETGDGPSALFYELKDEFRSFIKVGNNAAEDEEESLADLLSEDTIDTDMRGFLNGRSSFANLHGISDNNCLLSCFPQELQEVMVPKMSGSYLWLLNAYEAGGSRKYWKYSYDSRYQRSKKYMQNFKNRIAYFTDFKGGSSCPWWLSSSQDVYADSAYGINRDGEIAQWSVHSECGIVPGFNIRRKKN